MIVQGVAVDGSLIRLRHAPLLAEALRMFERANGWLPQWGREMLAEIDAATATQPKDPSGAEARNLPHRAPVRILSDVTYIGTAAAAERLGISGRAVRGQCERDQIPGAYLHGREWRIPANEIDKRRKATR